MKHKTRELTGALLDQAVALAEGLETEKQGLYTYARPKGGVHWDRFEPSTNWAQGGPLMDRERIGTFYDDGWTAAMPMPPDEFGHAGWYCNTGANTALEAAMRAYVASKFGDEIEM